MILVVLLEIGLFIFGLVSLALGKMTFAPSKVVEGLAGRLLGVLAMLPMPLAFGFGFVVGFMEGFKNPNGNPQQLMEKIAPTVQAVEIGLVVGGTALVVGIGLFLAGPSEEERRWRRRRRREEYYDDDDYDDRPRRRHRDEIDDDQPRSRRRRDDEDDYEDRPRRRRRDDDY